MSNKKLLNEFSFGFELEGTVDTNEYTLSSLSEKFDKLLNGCGYMHSDGSLRAEYGYRTFEYSSPVFKFTPSNIKMVIAFLDSLPLLSVKINQTCGFHTHISFSGITKTDAVWAIASMVADNSYEQFLKLGRTNLWKSPYAKPTFLKSARKLYELGRYYDMASILVDNEKYRSIRIHPQGTIEWRGPRTFLNTNKHSKNVAYFKKLTQFILRINNSLDMKQSGNLSKTSFLDIANNFLNNIYFKEEEISFKAERMANRLMNNPEMINHINDETFDFISHNVCASSTFSISKFISVMVEKNIKIASDIALYRMMNWTNISNLLPIIDVNTFDRNIAMIGSRNQLTPTFEYLMKHEDVNPQILSLLINIILTKFGKSSVKTFTYNGMLELIKYSVNAFIVATKLNLTEVFGESRAETLLKSVACQLKYEFKSSKIYSLLLDSPNAELVNRLFEYQPQEILNENMSSVVSSLIEEYTQIN